MFKPKKIFELKYILMITKNVYNPILVSLTSHDSIYLFVYLFTFVYVIHYNLLSKKLYHKNLIQHTNNTRWKVHFVV